MSGKIITRVRAQRLSAEAVRLAQQGHWFHAGERMQMALELQGRRHDTAFALAKLRTDKPTEDIRELL